MARDHARIHLGIWSDEEWRQLTPGAQHLYMVLLTQPTLTYAGVADWRPARIRALAGNWGTASFAQSAEELARGLYIVVDEDTEEVLIRTYVKHDGLMKQPNMATAMLRSYEATASLGIRGVFIHELNKLHDLFPDLSGWKSCAHILGNRSVDPSEYPTGYPSASPSVDPSVDPSVKGQSNPSAKGCPTPLLPYSLLPTPYSLLPSSGTTPEPAGYSSEFESFWTNYPRKEAKRQAWKAWGQAIGRATVEQITAGAVRYAQDPNRSDQYTKHGATWLNADGWEDEPLPQQVSTKRDNTIDAWGTPTGQTSTDFIDGEVVEFRRALP